MRYVVLRDGRKYTFDKMKIMGIINSTPDSFFEGSRTPEGDNALQRALRMIEYGADILDIGGESTRPGSDPVTEDEEIERVVPLIRAIREINKDIIISVDTYRARTAEESLKAGADIINDISAMTFDEQMAEVALKYDAPVILMHIKGTPKEMQKNPFYEDVLKEVGEFFEERIQYALSKGIKRDKLILDPGIGFGKLYEHNIELIKNIGKFHCFDLPILLAVSRKATIGAALGNLPAKERLEGTIAISCYAALNNIEMIRVHDVLENRRAVRMIEALK